MKALIIGAGIGGLATAIAFRLRGFEVAIFEKAPKLSEIGAGVQISPNGCRVLRALGVELEGGVYPDTVEMRDAVTGRMVFSLPIGELARTKWGAPYLHIHRADLQEALWRRFSELGGNIHFGQRIDDFTSSEQSCHVAGHQGDILIGADGVRSNVRAALFGEKGPEHSGFVAWRALIPCENLNHLPPQGATIWAGRGYHMVTTWISGGEAINFVGITPIEKESQGGPKEGSGDEFAQVEVREFDGVNEILRDIWSKARAAQELRFWPLLTKGMLPSFHQGRAVLIGDAAHPILPSFAQGAVMALEDGFILASLLAKHDPPSAFRAYDQLRLPRIKRVEVASRRNLALYHRSGLTGHVGLGVAWFAGRFAPSFLTSGLDWLYEYDATNPG